MYYVNHILEYYILQEDSASIALERTKLSHLSGHRIPDGPLAGYRRGVVITGLLPSTSYTVKEMVYTKNGPNSYQLDSNLGVLRTYTNVGWQVSRHDYE